MKNDFDYEHQNNWIIKLLKDNLKLEIKDIAQYTSPVDIVMVISNALRSRRLDAERFLSLYNKQVEDDRHIENQRDELLEALDLALKHTSIKNSVIAFSCLCGGVCGDCEKAKQSVAEINEARAIRDKFKIK